MSSVNLLSPTFIARRNALQATWRWGLSLIAAMLCIGLWCCYEYVSMVRADSRLTYVRTESQRQKKIRSEIGELTKRRQQLEEREHETFELGQNVPLLDLLGIVAKASSVSEGQVYLQRFQFGDRTAARGAQTGVRSLKLKGIAADNVAIARFAASIRDAKVFDAVELASTGISKSEDGRQHRSFDIHCSLQLMTEGTVQ